MADDQHDNSMDTHFEDLSKGNSEADKAPENIKPEALSEEAMPEGEPALIDPETPNEEAAPEDEPETSENDPEAPSNEGEDITDGRFAFEQTLEALGLPVNWKRPITPEDIAYLYERRPFIQLTTADGVEAYDEPKISYSKAGWVIINYGDALCCSPGFRLFNYAGLPHRSEKYGDDDDDGDGKPVGTIKGQTFLTAAELIALAKQQGWENIHIIDGLPAMIWATWIHASKHDMVLSNYNPTKMDEEMRERLVRDQEKDRRYSMGVKKFR